MTVRVEVNGYDLGTVTHTVDARNEAQAGELALNRQRSTLHRQFPDASSLSVEVVECGCGHPYHGDDLCTGTGATLDPMYGVPPDEACACVRYLPV